MVTLLDSWVGIVSADSLAYGLVPEPVLQDDGSDAYWVLQQLTSHSLVAKFATGPSLAHQHHDGPPRRAALRRPE